MDIIIRQLTEKDDPLQISNIYEQSWKYAYKGIIPQAYLDSIPSGRWVKSLDTPGRTHFAAELDGKLIGTASICPSRWEKHKDCGEIVSIYFLPDFMGKGFGGALFDRCVSELEEQGFERVILWVLEENSRARRFYEKNGFVCTGEYREDSIGGKTLREVLYSTQLGETLLDEGRERQSRSLGSNRGNGYSVIPPRISFGYSRKRP